MALDFASAVAYYSMVQLASSPTCEQLPGTPGCHSHPRSGASPLPACSMSVAPQALDQMFCRTDATVDEISGVAHIDLRRAATAPLPISRSS